MSKFLEQFANNNSGGTALRSAIIFGVAVMALSIVAAPALQDYSEQYASNHGYGIDGVTTGSVTKTKRYVLHRSVLSKEMVKICVNVDEDVC